MGNQKSDKSNGSPKDDPNSAQNTSFAGFSLSKPARGARAYIEDDSTLESLAPPEMMELAASCVRFVLAKYKVEMDFEPETLPLLDHYLVEARSELMTRPEALALTAQAAGAYLGEVMRRVHNCWWRMDPDDPGASRLEFRDVFLAVYPNQITYTAITKDTEGVEFCGFELPEADIAALAERLEEYPNVDEEQYYAPSTRVEILGITVDALIAKAIKTRTRRTYTPNDYA